MSNLTNLMKFLTSILIILNMIIIISPVPINNDLFSDKSIFFNKSIYFSTLKEGFISSSNKLINELEKPHKTDTMIIKIEKSIADDDSDSKNFLSLQITKSYYNIIACVETEKISNSLKNFFSNFAEISEQINQCYFSQDYFEFDFNNINSKNQEEKFTSTRKINYSNINILNENKNSFNTYSKIPLENLIDINLSEYKSAIEYFTSDFLMWNENCYFELILKLDSNTKNIFKLQKIFIYFSYPNQIEQKSYYISLIKRGTDTFDNIFIFHRNSNKIVKFSKKTLHNSKTTNDITVSDFTDDLQPLVYISTLRDESIYHNNMMITLNEHTSTLSKFTEASSRGSTNNDDICFLIFQPLTEDSYIENNEFKAFMAKRHTVIEKHNNNNAGVSLIYSKFIDQELSSDLASKCYLSFTLCESVENFKKLNYQISYPIHLRYQPALERSEKKYHQSVVMPQPYVHIIQKNITMQIPDIETAIFEQFFYEGNIFDRSEFYFGVKKYKSKDSSSKGFEIEFDQTRLFLEEVQKKLRFNINYYNTFLLNRDRLVHQVPAGKESHFMLVLTITVVATTIGVMLIIYGLLVYIFKMRNSESDLNMNQKNK